VALLFTENKVSKHKVHYNKIYTNTIEMYRELKEISGTASCAPFYSNTSEVSLFPLIIEYIADIESTLHRMIARPHYEVGIEFEKLQLYPFQNYTQKRKLIVDYIAPLESLNDKEDSDTDKD
jgi:hypothetical protein